MKSAGTAIWLWTFMAALVSTSVTAAHPKTFRQSHPGFADADPSADESLKLMRGGVPKFGGNDASHTVVGPHTAPMSAQEVQQEVERMVARATKLGDTPEATEMEEELEGVEASLAVTGAVGNAALEAEINATRAKLCAEHGLQQHQLAECEVLMRDLCAHGLPSGATPSQRKALNGPCASFQLRSTQSLKDGVARAAARKAAVAAAAPAPAAAAAGPGVLGGKKERALPAQGFSGYGELVEHNDLKTYAGDWGQEFGPKSGARNFRAICRDHPNNEWCRLHGYYDTVHSAAGRRTVMGCASFTALAAVLLIAY